MSIVHMNDFMEFILRITSSIFYYEEHIFDPKTKDYNCGIEHRFTLWDYIDGEVFWWSDSFDYKKFLINHYGDHLKDLKMMRHDGRYQSFYSSEEVLKSKTISAFYHIANKNEIANFKFMLDDEDHHAAAKFAMKKVHGHYLAISQAKMKAKTDSILQEAAGTACGKIKAIETEYNGHKFRSRLEARWAVFFDLIGLKWDYEHEGYDLDGVWYLPDFKVYSKHTGAVSFYEIKPSNVKQDDKFDRFQGKIHELMEKKNKEHEGILQATQEAFPEQPSEYFATGSQLLSGDPFDYFASISKSNCLICPRCGQIGKSSNDLNDDSYNSNCEDCDIDTPCGGDNDIEAGIMGCDVISYKGTIIVYEGGEFVEKFKQACKEARHYKFHK